MIEALIANATRIGATVVRAPGAVVIIIPDPSSRPNDLIPLDVVAQIAKTSLRVVKEAIRHGDLVGYGKQRNRSAKREDVDTWIESRRYRGPIMGPDVDEADFNRWLRAKEKRSREGPINDDIRRRIREIAKEDRAKARQKPASNPRK